MAEYQISNLIDPKLDGELSALIKRLEECQKAFQPLMEEVRETYKAMGAGSKDVKAMIQAFEKYNDVMAKGASETTRYRTIQQEIEQVQKQLNAANKEQLKVLEDLKAKRQALIAEAKRELAQEAAEQLQKEKSIAATKNATAQRIKEQEQLRRTRQEIKRLIDMGNGELSTYRQKSATLARLREAYKDVADNGIKRGMLKEIQNLDRALKREDAQLGVHTRNVGNYGRAFTTLIPGLSRFSTGFGVLGAGIVAAVAAFQKFNQAVRYGIQVNKEFEQANANLASVLGTSINSLQMMRQQAMELGRTTEYTAAQVTNAQIELAKLGFSEFSIRNMTEPLLGFATALDATLPAAAEVAGQALRAFNLSSTDTEEVLSLMTLAANRSAMDFGFLEKSIAIVGASASVAGVPLKDTMSLLGVLSNSGLDASRAATALRNIFLYLVDDSKKLGKELKGTEMNAEDIAEAFEELRKKGVDLADMFQLTDKRAVNALAVLIQNNGQIIELQNNLAATKGVLDQLRNTRLDTLQGDITLLKSAWDAFWLSFGENTPVIRSTIQWITTQLNRIVGRRQEKNYENPRSNSYGVNMVDRDKIEANVRYVSNDLRKAYDEYYKSLDSDNQDLQDTLYKTFLTKGSNYVTQFNKNLETTIENVRKFGQNLVSDANKGEYSYFSWEFDALNDEDVQTQLNDFARSWERVAEHYTIIRTEQEKINANQKELTNQDLSKERISELVSGISDSEQKIATEQEMIDRAYDHMGKSLKALRNIYGEGVVRSTLGVRTMVDRLEEESLRIQGELLTSQELAKAVAGTVQEVQQVNPMISTGEYDMQSGKDKQAADRLADRQRNYANKGELAEYTSEYERLKAFAEELKSYADNDKLSWAIRIEYAREYAEVMQDIANMEYQRENQKLTQDTVAANVGITEERANEIQVNPETGKIEGNPVTEMEQSLADQRLAVWYKYSAERIKLEQDTNNIIEKLIAGEAKDTISKFETEIESKLKGVENKRSTEKETLAKLFEEGFLKERTYKEEDAKIDVKFDQMSLDAIKMTYDKWMENVSLPDDVKEKIRKIIEDLIDEYSHQLSESSINLSETTGKRPRVRNASDTNGYQTASSRVRDAFNGVVRYDEDVKDPETGEVIHKKGDIDVTKTEKRNWGVKAGGEVAEFLEDDRVKLATGAFDQLNEVMNQHYDNEIARIEEVMAKQEEEYQKQQEMLDDRLSHVQDNYDAELLSEELYNAQRTQIEAEQRLAEAQYEKQKEEKEKEIQQLKIKQARWEKAQSIVSATINTAVGVSSALATGGAILGPILAATIAALGAAQIATIVGQQIPTYAKGTSDHKGGAMVVGDAGVTEYGITPRGELFTTPSTPTLMSAPKHTQIFPNEEALLNYLFSDGRVISSEMPDITVINDDKIQRGLLKSIDTKLAKINANERYRIKLERHNKNIAQW